MKKVKNSVFLGSIILIILGALLFGSFDYYRSWCLNLVSDRLPKMKPPIHHNDKLRNTSNTKIQIKSNSTFPKSKIIDQTNSSKTELFFTKIQSTFAEIKQPNASEDQMKIKLSAINAMGIDGVKLILDQLSKNNWSDAEIQRDLTLIDYLKYRMKWDTITTNLVIDSVSEKRPTHISIRNQAIWVSTRVELIEAIAKKDIDLAAKIVKSSSDPFYRTQLEYGIYLSLIDQGLNPNKAKQELARYL